MNNKHDYTDAILIGATVVGLTMILPIADSISNWVQSKFNASISRMQMELDLDAREHEAAAEIIQPSPSMTQAIGFQVQPEPEYEEEEYGKKNYKF